MPTGVPPLTVLRRASAGLPLGSRVHLLGRWLTCPFGPILDALPPRGRILDVGAGHGVLARLAVEAQGRTVVAVEPDVRKIGAALRHPHISWIAGFDTAVAGAFDAVVLCDVLYRVPLEDRDPLLGRLVSLLKPGGTLVLKDIDPGRRLKFAWNMLQETLAIHALGLTLGRGQTYESRGTIRQRLDRLGLTDFTARAVDGGYPHPHVLYTARLPESDPTHRESELR